jgi:hypothetical protein
MWRHNNIGDSDEFVSKAKAWGPQALVHIIPFLSLTSYKGKV